MNEHTVFDYQRVKTRLLNLIPEGKFRSNAEMVLEGWFAKAELTP